MCVCAYVRVCVCFSLSLSVHLDPFSFHQCVSLCACLRVSNSLFSMSLSLPRLFLFVQSAPESRSASPPQRQTWGRATILLAWPLTSGTSSPLSMPQRNRHKEPKNKTKQEPSKQKPTKNQASKQASKNTHTHTHTNKHTHTLCCKWPHS